ncbi:putative transmembrane protein [Toxoplasma gondii MAS]|uniref:Putative transmembrane protein n=1 Tax=Toxoplasma gondii MAS TaxID=943118 RepID=A0A086QVS7_TOXGO|nr:putative transmembrane protein [Toxoplasma gondii MAS]
MVSPSKRQGSRESQSEDAPTSWLPVAVGATLGALAVGAVGWFLYRGSDSERERQEFERRRVENEELQREREKQAESDQGVGEEKGSQETPAETSMEASTADETQAAGEASPVSSDGGQGSGDM